MARWLVVNRAENGYVVRVKAASDGVDLEPTNVATHIAETGDDVAEIVKNELPLEAAKGETESV